MTRESAPGADLSDAWRAGFADGTYTLTRGARQGGVVQDREQQDRVLTAFDVDLVRTWGRVSVPSTTRTGRDVRPPVGTSGMVRRTRVPAGTAKDPHLAVTSLKRVAQSARTRQTSTPPDRSARLRAASSMPPTPPPLPRTAQGMPRHRRSARPQDRTVATCAGPLEHPGLDVPCGCRRLAQGGDGEVS